MLVYANNVRSVISQIILILTLYRDLTFDLDLYFGWIFYRDFNLDL